MHVSISLSVCVASFEMIPSLFCRLKLTLSPPRVDENNDVDAIFFMDDVLDVDIYENSLFNAHRTCIRLTFALCFFEPVLLSVVSITSSSSASRRHP